MSHIFYSFAIVGILLELVSISSPRRVGKVFKFVKERGDKEFPTHYAVFLLIHVMYLIWGFVGLMSSQWVLFLAFILFSCIPLKKYTWYRVFDGIISLLIVLFILVNAYHLHIDVLGWVKSIFISWK